MDDGYEGDGGVTVETLAGLYRCIREVLAERSRLRAVLDAADDFWPLIESIYDQALSSWEHNDERMKYVTVQISKADLPTLYAAYAPREVTDG